MKHEVTSRNTRKLLSLTLKNIMREKDLSKISISEVAKASGLNRKTFYYHFDDIYSLLVWTLEDDAFGVMKKIDLVKKHREASDILLDYLEKNYEFIDNVMHSSAHLEVREFLYVSLRDNLLKTVKEICNENDIKLEDDYQKFVAGFCTEAYGGMILHWLRNKDRISRKKLQDYLDRIFEASVKNLLMEAAKI